MELTELSKLTELSEVTKLTEADRDDSATDAPPTAAQRCRLCRWKQTDAADQS